MSFCIPNGCLQIEFKLVSTPSTFSRLYRFKIYQLFNSEDHANFLRKNNWNPVLSIDPTFLIRLVIFNSLSWNC
ncbi:hypothetical protein L6452_00914 [Arctium lappa]|uniref:Uncharacterized protein n=1 Tax=Arctium lappa TaxID=4217 RepID=A0ACB9FG26_ARCLA|nr:hypothetical protein L6452_00914 [Arctium lappa]